MRLTKHHGLGNDFLVLLAERHNDASLARALCDRRRGIGADGLIVGRRGDDPGVDVVMDLRNADGSVAEMSGNGIRCLAQAVVERDGARDSGGGGSTVVIDTLGGLRTVVVHQTSQPDICNADVSMGPVTDAPIPLPAPPPGLLDVLGTSGFVAATASIGNPHLVVLANDPRTVDLAMYGSALEAAVPGGVNVEFIAKTRGESSAIDLTVWERGVGITEACGTGASAAAHVAHAWGLVGKRVVVHLPGGAVEVMLGADVHLIGPSQRIASIEVEVLPA